jgi:membrane-bound lytic murein transglycosylase A
LPIAGDRPTTRFRRLMIAQDTGSAIVGPARADVFFGAGEDAGRVAGRIKQMGRFAILVPREIDPAVAAAHMPLPRAKPKIAEPIVPRLQPKPKLEPEPKLAVGVPGHSGHESAGKPSAEPNTGVLNRRRTVR